MKVILRKDFSQLGQIGDIVDVKNGYALNYLIPRQIAYHANEGNIRVLEEEKKQLAKIQAQELESAKELAAQFENLSVTIPVKVGEEDKLFGTVTAQDIADALKAKEVDIDKRKIEIAEPIKALGIYDITVKLHSEVETVLKTWVVRE
ncbi:MAG: 50S ribosomal protein L9 [Melioribacteraceae bacterium]|nr:MAG: 50S ribosomal protein L9 [Melioribacteraceae bacterium]